MRLAALLFILAVTLLFAKAARSDEESQSITLTPGQIAELERQAEEIMARRERAAFEAGVNYQKQACRSLI